MLAMVKMGIAIVASILGLLMPWRMRVVYSEVLGWVANLIPPELHRMDEAGEEVPHMEQGGGPE